MTTKVLPLVIATFFPLLAWADATCPSDYASVAPPPSELVKLCPDESVLAQPADIERTNNPLICGYTFGHQPKMPSVPQARLRVGSNEGKKIEEAMKVTDPKAVAERVAKGMGAELKASVAKLPWKGVDAFRVDTQLAGMARTGDMVFVKSSKGVVNIQLKVGNKVPACLEKVAEYVAHH